MDTVRVNSRWKLSFGHHYWCTSCVTVSKKYVYLLRWLQFKICRFDIVSYMSVMLVGLVLVVLDVEESLSCRMQIEQQLYLN